MPVGPPTIIAMKPFAIPAAIAAFSLAAPAATTVFSTDFASLTDGSVTNTDLNGASTGGTWYLNPNRGASYEIQDSSGDKALMLDDPDSTGNGGTIQFAGITLDSTIDLTVDDGVWDFRTAVRRAGTDKALRYQFYDATGNTVAATIDWYNGNNVILNFGEDSGTAGFTFLNPWDAASGSVRDVSVSFSGGTVGVSFGGATLAGTVQNGVTDIGRLKIYSISSSVQARGLFLDDVTVTTTAVPEPAVALLGAGLLGLGLRRRR